MKIVGSILLAGLTLFLMLCSTLYGYLFITEPLTTKSIAYFLDIFIPWYLIYLILRTISGWICD